MATVLGKKYEDSITGFAGVATARTEFLAGCARVCLETADETDIKTTWLDETRLKDVQLTPQEEKPGGYADPPPARDPSR